jgi:hypothetical protein
MNLPLESEETHEISQDSRCLGRDSMMMIMFMMSSHVVVIMVEVNGGSYWHTYNHGYCTTNDNNYDVT